MKLLRYVLQYHVYKGGVFMDKFIKIQVKDLKIGDKFRFSTKHYHEVLTCTSLSKTKSGKRIKIKADKGGATLSPYTEILKMNKLENEIEIIEGGIRAQPIGDECPNCKSKNTGTFDLDECICYDCEHEWSVVENHFKNS